MPRYIALLRAINVGGARIIKMEDLRKHFAIRCFSNIATYIQSGNVLFDTKETDKLALAYKIEKKLLKELGYEVTVVVRSIEDIAAIIENDPFKKKRAEGDKYYVVFLKEEPAAELVKALRAFENEVDSFYVIGNDLYWLCKKQYGESVVSSAFFEKKLKVPATNRNWNTVNKVLEL
jgi:uncharacterized protein (DUF1697 family)